PRGFREPAAREMSGPGAGAAGGASVTPRTPAATPVIDKESSSPSVPVHAHNVPGSRGAFAVPVVGQEAGIVVVKVTTFPTTVPLLIGRIVSGEPQRGSAY